MLIFKYALIAMSCVPMAILIVYLIGKLMDEALKKDKRH